ncbi:hypothetical protein BRN01_24050 [Xanthomonas oryzae pv. oryzae]|nr:hypothetical protein BRN32_13835 [Xanthomonas oryzae pv. oryzae]AXM17530.1 hypothetical protein BRN66_13365 [Xanthomonas oryzae pv. oryzae]AXM21400.1 hypothetical protein BRM88_13990 [Xanthomonas oryzae pv. oryzae]AXM24498.1 hypothetical protein BRM77_08505 [Xanthomonas oryzae pv. oryzae]AXM36518.1 hypothetical protein BRM84_13665 [Xanthomonas oryzae pv. oryzae]
MTWATPFGSEVAQVRSPGSLHNRWCCDPELKPPPKKSRPRNVASRKNAISPSIASVAPEMSPT